MAVRSFKNAFVTVDGNDIGAFIKSATLTYSREGLDKTGISDDTRSRIGGIKDWTVDMEFYQDFDSGSVDEILFNLVGSSTFVVELKASSSAADTSNPMFTGTGFLESYTPIAGTVGELMMTPVRILAAGDLSRLTST